MPTSALLVEIVIVGFSFFLSLLPFVVIIFKIEPNMVLTFYSNIPLQYQIAAAYAAGVIWNRVCDQLFSKFDHQITLSLFRSKKLFQAIRIQVIMEGESIRDYMGNFRSLIRVTRSAAVLLLIYTFATPVYLFDSSVPQNMVLSGKIAIILLELILTALSVYAWFRLVRGYVAAIKDAHDVVVKKKRK